MIMLTMTGNMIKLKELDSSVIFYALICLSCMNFLGRGSIVFMLACIWALFHMLIKSTKIHFDPIMLVVLFFSLFYSKLTKVIGFLLC